MAGEAEQREEAGQGSPSVLMREKREARREVQVDTTNLHRPILWVGWTLVIASLLTYVLLWWAPQFGVPEWQFSTVSQTLDRMPLMVLGLGMVAVGTLLSGSVSATRVVAGLLAGLAVVLAGLVVMYVFASLVAWGHTSQGPPEAKQLLIRAVAKTVLLGGLYTGLFGALGWTLYRRTRSTGNAGTV